MSSTKNRDSIDQHGLDPGRMGAAPGIAGSTSPEVDGCFLCTVGDADYFVWMNNTGGPVDVWQVAGVEWEDLVDSGSGYQFVPGTIERSRLRLVEQDLPPARQR